jgi:hypothetical protein
VRIAPWAALAAVVCAAAACGGGGSARPATTAPATTAPPATTTPVDPGRDAIEAFVGAARAGKADAMWRLLSRSSRERLGPTLAEFRKHAAVELREGVGSFGPFRVIVSERITPEFGVVAIDGRRLVEGSRARDVYATALRLEGDAWKVEPGGPVVVRPIGPDPGARENVVAQVAAAVEGPAGVGTAVMYVDGATEHPQVRGTATNSTLFANSEGAAHGRRLRSLRPAGVCGRLGLYRARVGHAAGRRARRA